MSYGHLIKYLNMTLVVADRNYRKSRRVGPAATTVMDFGLYSGRCAMIEPHSVLTLGSVTNKRLHHIGLKLKSERKVCTGLRLGRCLSQFFQWSSGTIINLRD